MPDRSTRSTSRSRRLGGETEPLRDARTGAQLQQAGGLDPAVGQAQQVEQQGDHRVDLGHRAVGHLYPEALRGMHGGAGRGRERCPDEGGEGVHVGGEHHDVARFERRVRGEEPGEHFAQHLHLPVAAVGEVHPDRAVAGPSSARGTGCRSARRSDCSQPSSVSGAAGSAVGAAGGSRRAVSSATTARDSLSGCPGSRVTSARRRSAPGDGPSARRCGGERRSRRPVVAAEGSEQVERCRRRGGAGRARRCASASPGTGPAPSRSSSAARRVQRVVAQLCGEQPPQVGLPGVGAQRRAVRTGVGAVGPRRQHRGPVARVAGELAGDPVGGGEALPRRGQVALQHVERRVVGRRRPPAAPARRAVRGATGRPVRRDVARGRPAR